MMNPLQGLGDKAKLIQEAMKMQKEIQKEQVTITKNDVEVTASGDQRIVSIKTNGQSDDRIREAINEALKKSQEIAAKKIQQMGGMGGLGGLLGK
ncbi:MAG TPA: YbaB/EbfC family nucleoid-associated protein [Candidatus Saccharimonadales bacterium]|nr:YbaB/EbfC family nucleoid-associated protein [Candidatus Saccharimonadales bacterium]